MEKETIRNIVENVFKEVYGTYGTFAEGDCYDIHEIMVENSQQLNFIIIERVNGILVEFWVSSYSVFDAKSNQVLLASTFELKNWLDFITKVHLRLKEAKENGSN